MSCLKCGKNEVHVCQKPSRLKRTRTITAWAVVNRNTGFIVYVGKSREWTRPWMCLPTFVMIRLTGKVGKGRKR